MDTEKKPLYLLVDDNAIDIKVHSRMLSISGLTDNIISFSSAGAALEYLTEHDNQPDKLPDIILLDIQMPEMSGFGFLEAYDKLPGTITDKPKIIMLSTTMFREDIEQADANKHVHSLLNKPLDTQKLKSVLGQLSVT